MKRIRIDDVSVKTDSEAFSKGVSGFYYHLPNINLTPRFLMTLQGPPLTRLNVPSTKEGSRRFRPLISFGIYQSWGSFLKIFLVVLKLGLSELCY